MGEMAWELKFLSLNRGQHKSVIVNKVQAFLWKDKNNVNFLNTMCNSQDMTTVKWKEMVATSYFLVDIAVINANILESLSPNIHSRKFYLELAMEYLMLFMGQKQPWALPSADPPELQLCNWPSDRRNLKCKLAQCTKSEKKIVLTTNAQCAMWDFVPNVLKQEVTFSHLGQYT